jgi:hypothetical protein
MDNIPSDVNLARTIDTQLILIESNDVVPLNLAEKVQLNIKLITKTPLPTNSHPIMETIILLNKYDNKQPQDCKPNSGIHQGTDNVCQSIMTISAK